MVLVLMIKKIIEKTLKMIKKCLREYPDFTIICSTERETNPTGKT